MACKRVAVVLRIIFVESPVTAVVEASKEVDMTVLEFGKHIAQHLQLLIIGHARVETGRIDGMDRVPVDTFLLKEAVMLIHDLPQRLEIAQRRVFIHILIDARRERQGKKQERKQPQNLLHLRSSISNTSTLS